MAKCQRDGCENPTNTPRATFCSHRCASLVRSALLPPGFFARISRLGHAGRRKAGAKALRQSDRMLMAAGRYEEAALALYDRGYGAGWVAARKGNRQLPQRRVA